MARDVSALSMMDRRTFVGGGLCLCGFHTATTQALPREGCVLYQTAPASGDTGLAGLSRLNLNDHFANGLVIILGQLAEVLTLKASFGLYDDDDQKPNAVASPTSLLPMISGAEASDGTVAVGRKLISVLEVQERDFGSALTAICAHEFGHILQFQTVINDLGQLPNSIVRRELHADFVCGYFAAYRRESDPRYDALTQAITQYHFGDGQYNQDVKGHGTYEQRGNAVYAGFLLGRRGRIEPKRVAVLGLDYVRNLNL